MQEQAEKLTLTSRAFRNDQLGLFYKELCELTHSHLALPMNSGAEAVESCIKAVRKWGYKVKGVPDGKAEIIVCANNFHSRTITPYTVAFLVEPIQGEAGIIMPPEGYLRDIQHICTEHDVVLITDEIQTGLGRTGKLLAEEHEGIEADLTLISKALSGDFYPVSAVLSNKEVLGVYQPGDHGSTSSALRHRLSSSKRNSTEPWSVSRM